MNSPYTWSFVTAANTQTITQLPLVYQSNLQYVGAFRVPGTTDGTDNLDYAGQGLAFNPANNSLFISAFGVDSAIANITIPSSIVDSSNLSNLATASYVQPTVNALNMIPNSSNVTGKLELGTGGLMVVNGKLVGTEYSGYDTSGTTYETDFRFDSLNLSSAQVEGMFEVGGTTLGGGAPRLPERQQGFTTDIWFHTYQLAVRPGAPDLTGNCCMSIISRTSSGPAAFGSIRIP